MVENLTSFFFENWQRKGVSFFLAAVIWLWANHSMMTSKTIHHVPVRVIHLAEGKTIEGMQLDGTLNRRLVINLYGKKHSIEDLTGQDLEVVIDAAGKPDEWIASVSKKNLISINPRFELLSAVTRVEPLELIMKQSKRVTEKIPILITRPIGEAPKGYQFLDVWPYQLSLSVTGSEETIKQLKTRGLKLTFNLNDVSASDLDPLASEKKQDEVSFFVPNNWKKIILPQLSETPVEIDDPQAKFLRMDFAKQDLLPIDAPLPVTLFFPPKYSATLNPETYSLAVNDFVIQKNGIKSISTPLYAQGVSRIFLDTVKNMMQLVVIAAPGSERSQLQWSVQFINPQELEDRYIARVMSEPLGEGGDGQPQYREEHLRNRFRNYMNRFSLYTADKQKLSLRVELQANTVMVSPLQLTRPP